MPRPKGSPNLITKEIREMGTRLLSSTYEKALACWEKTAEEDPAKAFILWTSLFKTLHPSTPGTAALQEIEVEQERIEVAQDNAAFIQQKQQEAVAEYREAIDQEASARARDSWHEPCQHDDEWAEQVITFKQKILEDKIFRRIALWRICRSNHDPDKATKDYRYSLFLIINLNFTPGDDYVADNMVEDIDPALDDGSR